MRKYIDAEKLKAGMLHYGFSAPDMTITEFIEDECPAADVAKVRHSEWYVTTAGINSIAITCSYCHCTEKISVTNYFDYCPKCGSKMDGERKVEK